jgi:hypothetical protein
MTAQALRRTGRALSLAAVLVGAVLLAPAAALAADEVAGAPVTVAAVAGVGSEVFPDLSTGVGPLLLLLVACALGLLGALSGPESAPAQNRSVHRPHEHTH